MMEPGANPINFMWADAAQGTETQVWADTLTIGPLMDHIRTVMRVFQG